MAYNIVVIVSGIDQEYQNSILHGIHNFSSKNNINLFHFIAFGGIMTNASYDLGEYEIFSLPDFTKFDGAIILANTIQSKLTVNNIIEAIKDAHIPAVSIDKEIDGFYNIGIDNVNAMKKIVEHFVNFHGCKTFNYISGPENNTESRDRLKAFTDTLKENNLELDEKRIYFGDFQAPSGNKAAIEFINSGLKLPDVVISANDVMAISALSTFESLGYKIPDDLYFSGFDNTYEARNYSPELSSVHRPLEQSGFLACEKLFQHFKGGPVEKSTLLDMSTCFTESCGCSQNMSDNIESFKKHSYKSIEKNSISMSLINRMSSQLVECENFDEYITYFKSFITEINAEEFYLCLYNDWYSPSYSESKLNFNFNDKKEDIYVPIAYVKGMFKDHLNFKASEMLPSLFNQYEKNKNYYFVPVHFRERSLGYMVIMNSSFPIESSMFQTWNITVNNTLENIRKIIFLDYAVKKLDKLYTIDPLSNVYNRNGFKRFTSDLFMYCIKRKRNIMVMFIDMDDLKLINDTYGHKSGDLAIKKIADSLKVSCTNGEIYCRFGGDEFIVFAADYSIEDAENLKNTISTNLEAIAKSENFKYELSASIGYHIQVPNENDNIFQLITIADKIMYEEKKKKKKSKYLKHSK